MTSNQVFDQLRERCTGMQRPEEFMRKPAVFEMNEQLTGSTRMGMDRNEEYELTLTVGVRYWANKAQVFDARRNAESVLAHALYRDVLGALAGIRHAIYDGDRSAAIARLDELAGSLTR